MIEVEEKIPYILDHEKIDNRLLTSIDDGLLNEGFPAGVLATILFLILPFFTNDIILQTLSLMLGICLLLFYGFYFWPYSEPVTVTYHNQGDD